MNRALRLLALCVFAACVVPSVAAHEVRPAYLELSETSSGLYQVDWKSPVRSGRPLAVVPVFPEDCTSDQASETVTRSGFLVSSYQLDCESDLEGRAILISGLETTITDVIVRLNPRDTPGQTLRATPDNPSVEFVTEAGSLQVAQTYFILGVEHILFGIDHLLFVLALVLLIPGIRKLIETITAFTLAHSVTLIGASLGWFALPSAPVEAVIALSIVFLASEIAKKRAGRLQLSERRPWLVASAFGLLHGFGFAGALSDIGLPQGDIPLALAAFNIGVEAGQLAFVCVLLFVLAAIHRLRLRRPAELLMSYSIGITASIWLFERMM